MSEETYLGYVDSNGQLSVYTSEGDKVAGTELVGKTVHIRFAAEKGASISSSSPPPPHGYVVVSADDRRLYRKPRTAKYLYRGLWRNVVTNSAYQGDWIEDFVYAVPVEEVLVRKGAPGHNAGPDTDGGSKDNDVPEGYRLVTDEEKRTCRQAKCLKYRYCKREAWRDIGGENNRNFSPAGEWTDGYEYIVPKNFLLPARQSKDPIHSEQSDVPEGYRLVTDEEKRTCKQDRHLKYRDKGTGEEWKDIGGEGNKHFFDTGGWIDDCEYAVPETFVLFPKESPPAEEETTKKEDRLRVGLSLFMENCPSPKAIFDRSAEASTRLELAIGAYDDIIDDLVRMLHEATAALAYRAQTMDLHSNAYASKVLEQLKAWKPKWEA